MDPKNKTLIPLIIIFFILGVVVGYAAHKPQTIVKIEEKEKIVTVTVTVTPFPTPAPTLTPTFIPTATPTPEMINFTIKNYNSDVDKPTAAIELANWRANPSELRIRSMDAVLIKIADYTISSPLKLVLNSQEWNLGTSGAVVVTFNNKGIYGFKAVMPSSDVNVLPRTYAEGTIIVI